MRFLSVSSPPGTILLSVGTRPGEMPFGFAVELPQQLRGRCRFRSVKFGPAVVVAMRVGEADSGGSDTGGAGGAASETPYVVVGSDDGFTEVTLLRVAAVISELCMFLDIGSSSNMWVLRTVLAYIEQRLACFDLSFLCQAVEVVEPGISATGYAKNPRGLMDQLLRNELYPAVAPDEQLPGYVAAFFGHKLMMESTALAAEEACKINGVDRFHLGEADRYLITLVAAAFFAVPPVPTTRDVDQREQRMRRLERVVERLGITRHNVTRVAARRLAATYVAMLRDTAGGRKPAEEALANAVEGAFNELLSYVAAYPERSPPLGKEESAGAAEDAAAGADEAGAAAERNPYHHPLVPLDDLAQRPVTLEHCVLRNSPVACRIQLVWAHPAPSESELFAQQCPSGYAVCAVYFPGRDERDEQQLRASRPQLVRDEVLHNFSATLAGALDTDFTRLAWLLNPPVESYEVPGLIHFVAVDRRDNTCLVGSFERMAQAKPRAVRLAVNELHRTMAQCISRAHELLAQGYSEGLWGHVGMQFFFSVGTATTLSAAVAGAAAGGDKAATQSGGRPGGGGGAAGAAQEKQTGLFGSGDARKLPNSVLEHLVLRPMLVPEMHEDKQFRVVEFYAMFIGCMSPAEVVKEIDFLRTSRLFVDAATR